MNSKKFMVEQMRNGEVRIRGRQIRVKNSVVSVLDCDCKTYATIKYDKAVTIGTVIPFGEYELKVVEKF